ncbi:TraB/GumN family protein [Algoriphagus sp.]|uniref:TraB/GumN family protein n=1 Tax=Algoriphagus sp. TaxID=1872435 RepID=UPI00391A51D3
MRLNGKYLLLFFGIFALFLGTQFQIKAQNESFYYKLIHPDTKAESFLFGTYHNYPEGWFEVPDMIKDDLAKSSALITEIGNIRSSDFGKKINKAVRYRPGKTVLDKLTKYDREAFQKYIDEKIRGSTNDQRDVLNYKPYFMFTRLFGLRFSDQVMSMESELKAITDAKNIPIQDLEPDHRRLLKYYKKYARKSKAKNIGLTAEIRMLMTSKMFADYLQNDIAAMRKAAGGASQYAKERNHYWVPQLVKKLREPSFVAVGAGHLIGQQAVQELLKGEGFIVEPIILSLPLPQALIDYLSEQNPQ